MKLVIAEKPSVAMALAKVLGATGRRDGYTEGGGWLVSWCVGHLVEMAAPDAYDERYSKWAYEDLPVIPDPWQYIVLPDTRKQFNILSALMADSRVESLVCATDAGREGELIFRQTYHLCGCRKPVQRLWISSMEDSAIRDGFANLRDSADYDRLYAAALCRAKADWLVGINGTRLFTTLHGGQTLNVGRVQTPTLALLADRAAAIKQFKKEKFYMVELDGRTFKAVSGRIQSKTDADKLRRACDGRDAVVKSVERVKKTEQPPKLYDLTTLQREANRLYGYTAQQTLDYIQSLYEKRLLTYPRTDSRYLTSDMGGTAAHVIQLAAQVPPFDACASFAPKVAGMLSNEGVTDHHAIIPTAEIERADLDPLPSGERNLLLLVCCKLLCAAAAPYVYETVTVAIDCGESTFTAKGTRVISEGWREIERVFRAALKTKPEGDTPDAPLPELTEGQEFARVDAAVAEHYTAPPKPYTEDTLLSAMERAGAEDFAELENVERTGLGTPATRAGIIEKLVRAGFAERKKKQIIPTEKGLALVWAMPDQLKSAKLTAEWEARLGEVERGERSPEDFMGGITRMVTDLVKSYAGASTANSTLSQTNRTVVGVCPRCGKNVVEGKKSFYCEGYHDTPSCGFALWKNDLFFTSKRKELNRKVVAALLKHGRVRMTGLFSEKKGVLYDATVVMQDDGGKYVRFKLEFDNKKGGKQLEKRR